MECNVIKTNSFISFGSIYVLWSLGIGKNFGWVDFLAIYFLFNIICVRTDSFAFDV